MSENVMRRFLAHTDLLAAVAVVMIVTMLVIPLPTFLLDMLITLNISAALAIVVATMYLGKALDFSVFPSLLLLTTMFRLAINVSATRASSWPRRGDFFVAWGIVAAFVIGGVVGSYMIPRERKLEELATREVAAAGASGATVATVTWSPEYEKLQKQVGTVGALLDLLVVITVFLMATHAGA